MVENEVPSSDEALKRHLEESGETERAVGSRIGINRHNLHRWLSDKQSPKKAKLAQHLRAFASPVTYVLCVVVIRF